MSEKIRDIVAIGTSTGGPRALQEVLTGLPADFASPILIVQHMPPNFTKSLANRLNTLCEVNVFEATDGQRITPGSAYIAPGNYHMRAVKDKNGAILLQLDQETPPVTGHRPSVDVLFSSLIPLTNIRKHFVIMTGMGKDGTNGLREVREKVAHDVNVIAEHESTCVVFGMPRSAIQAGVVDHVIPLHRIANQLLQSVTR